MSAANWKITQLVMALTLALGVTMAPIHEAEAGKRGRALAAGIALGVIGGAIIAGQTRRGRRFRRHRRHRVRCYSGPRQCGFVGIRECYISRFGERVCEGGRYRCWRERFCD